ncbi:MAG: hypothetical protein GC161_01955 [Planctomycetaceae bacterium]|nr:hypothetical protein [Planctomycetaceae bacterium]
MLSPTLALAVLPLFGQGTPFVTVPLPAAPSGVVGLDLEGDGAIDLAVTMAGVDLVQLLHNDGLGNLALGGALASGDRPVALASGDLNADGVADLVAVNRMSKDASIWLSAGGGAFGPRSTLALGARPVCVELADVVGDSALDLLVGTDDEESVRIFAGLGNGSFAAPVAYLLNGVANRLAIGDVDGDGDLDTMVSARFAGTRLLRNQAGQGSIVEFVPGSFGGFTDWVCLFDGDQDGDLDELWVENDTFSADPEVRPNDGTGTWFGFPVSVFVKNAFFRIAEAFDWNGDGDPDFACIGGPGQSSNNDTVYLRRGGTGVSVQLGFETIHVGGRWADARVVDLNGDGRGELVGANAALGNVQVLFPPCPGTAINSVVPAQVPSLSSTPTTVTLVGCGLGSATTAFLGGTQVDFLPLSADGLQLNLGPLSALGTLSIQVFTPFGSAVASLDVVAPSPPLLVLANDVLSVQQGLLMSVGAEPGSVAFVGVSPDLLPTNLPGLVELAIGAGGTSLVVLPALPIPAKGWQALAAPIPPALVGTTFHFQGAVWGPSQELPLATTAALSAIVVP